MLRLRLDPGGIPRILKGGRVFTILGLFTLMLSFGVLYLLLTLPTYEALGRLSLVWASVGLGILGLYLVLSTLTEFGLLLPIDTPSEPERIEKERDELKALFESNTISGAEAEVSKLREESARLLALLELIPRRELASNRKGGRKRGKKKTVYQDPLDVLHSILEENSERGQLKKDLSKLERERDQFEQKLQQSTNARKDDFERLQTERDEAIRKMSQSAEALKLAAERIDPLETQVEDLTRKLEETESAAGREAEDLRRQLEDCKTTSAQHTEQMQEKSFELSKVKETLAEAELAGRNRDEEYQTLVTIKRELESEVARLQSALEASQHLAQGRLNSLEELRKQLTEVTEGRAAFERETKEQQRLTTEAHRKKLDELQAVVEEFRFHRLKVFEEMRRVEGVPSHVHPGSSLACHTRRILRIISEAETRLFIASILAQDNRWDFVESLTRPARLPDVFDAILNELPADLRTYCQEQPKFVESD